jgi:predicted transcriptional regulator of viral defense system
MPKSGISAPGRADLGKLTRGGRRFVTVDDACERLGLERREAAKRLARWAADGWLRRVRRGLYIPVPADADEPSRWTEDPLLIADAIWRPCYFTGWTAANHWALTEQTFSTTVLKTTARVRRSNEEAAEHRFLVHHAAPALLEWGLTTVWRGEVRLRFADPARTLIDVLDDPALAGGIRHPAAILSAYLDEHDGTPLVDYGDRLGNGAVFKRLGYLLEQTRAGPPDLVEACAERLTSGLSLLDPAGGRRGRIVSRWGLRVNVALGPVDAS